MNNMMKKSIKICSLALVLAGCGAAGTFSVCADEPAAKAEDASSSPVGKALEKADYLTKDRPNTKARYYLFFIRQAGAALPQGDAACGADLPEDPAVGRCGTGAVFQR